MGGPPGPMGPLGLVGLHASGPAWASWGPCWHLQVLTPLVNDRRAREAGAQALQKLIYTEFERCFEEGDGKALNPTVLSGESDVNVILLDCLMYEDDVLFAKALSALDTQLPESLQRVPVVLRGAKCHSRAPNRFSVIPGPEMHPAQTR